ncbi:MAG: FtsW/RodA/SpoVE family cell cycle protein [Firmicutes bacterium]|nr:FtsW/RodA/SpoVE family cell cycle protein [Bacillota bacterium]
MSAGVGLHHALQVIINIAVVTATFFPTGVVLPLVSLGGNATMLFLAEFGIVYNISKKAQVEPEESFA